MNTENKVDLISPIQGTETTATEPMSHIPLAQLTKLALEVARAHTIRRCAGRYFLKRGDKWERLNPDYFLAWLRRQVHPTSPLARISLSQARQILAHFDFRSHFHYVKEEDLGYPPLSTDCTGHPLREGDHVSPIAHPGSHREAPVYRIQRICTDGETIHLTRSDGSTLYRSAGSLRYLPETTAAARH